MKHRNLMGRFAAGALALMLVIGTGATPVFAAGSCTKAEGCTAVVHDKDCKEYVSTNTVRVNGAVPGAEYKLLQLERTDEEKTVTGEGDIRSCIHKR